MARFHICNICITGLRENIDQITLYLLLFVYKHGSQFEIMYFSSLCTALSLPGYQSLTFFNFLCESSLVYTYLPLTLASIYCMVVSVNFFIAGFIYCVSYFFCNSHILPKYLIRCHQQQYGLPVSSKPIFQNVIRICCRYEIV